MQQTMSRIATAVLAKSNSGPHRARDVDGDEEKYVARARNVREKYPANTRRHRPTSFATVRNCIEIADS